MSPQIISTDLVRGAHRPSASTQTCVEDPAFYGDLSRTICDVNELRVRYLNGVTDEATLHNLLAAGLLTISAAGIYRGITDSGAGVSKLLAKLGIGGAALYAFDQNFISQPRQRVYLAGADALACTVAASAPMLYRKEELTSLKTAMTRVRTAVGRLDAPMSQLLQAGDLTETVPDPQQGCSIVEKTLPIPSDTSPVDQKQLSKSGNTSNTQGTCSNRSALLVKRLTDAVARAKAVSASTLENAAKAQWLLSQGDRARGQIDGASDDLLTRAARIQNDVAREVQKTQPNLDAILSGVGAMRMRATFKGSDLFSAGDNKSTADATPKVTLQKRGTKATPPEERLLQARAERLEQWTSEMQRRQQALARDRVPLEGWLAYYEARTRQLGALDACTVNGQAALALELSPEVDEIQLGAKDSFTFRVFGITGAPQAQFVGPNLSKLTLVVAGPMITVTLNDALPQGQKAVLLITDATGGARRQILVSGASAKTAAGTPEGATSATDVTSTSGSADDQLSADEAKEACTKIDPTTTNDPVCLKSSKALAVLDACRKTIAESNPDAKPSDALVIRQILSGACKAT